MLNANLIRGQQQVNPLAAYHGGVQTRSAHDQIKRQNALHDFVKQNGAGIFSGDQNTLAQYAQFDPQAALGVQNQHQQMEMRRRADQRAAAASARAAASAKRAAASQAAAQAEKDKLRQFGEFITKGQIALQTGRGDQFMQENGMEGDLAAGLAEMAAEHGMYEQALSLVAPPDQGKVIEGADGYKYYQNTGERVLPDVEVQSDPKSALGVLNRELEAGLITPEQHAAGVAKATESGGMALRTNPDGSVEFSTGGAATLPTSRQQKSSDVKMMEKAREAATEADNLLQELDAAEAVLDSGFNTGIGAPAQAFLSGVGEAVGITDGTTATQNQQLESASKKIAMDGLRLLGGNDTERELLTSMQTTVSTTKTEEANRKILKKQRAAAQVLTERSAFMDRWVADNGSLSNQSGSGKTFAEAWREYQVPRFRELIGGSDEQYSPEMSDEQFIEWLATQ